MYYTYILISKTHQTHYYGSTQDVAQRLKDHNSGKVRYTKGRRPWEIVYTEVRISYYATEKGINFKPIIKLGLINSSSFE